MLTIRVLTETVELEALAEPWEELLVKADESSIYLTHDWVSSWWRHLGSRNKLNVLLFQDGSQLVGVIPLMSAAYNVGVFKVRVLETIGATNCNLVGLVMKQYLPEVVFAFLTYLAADAAGRGLIVRLPLVTHDSRFLEELRKASSRFRRDLILEERLSGVAPYLSVPVNWNDYFTSLGPRRRKQLRRAQRFIETEHAFEFRRFTPEQLRDGMDSLFELHQRRWRAAGIRSAFCDPRQRDFYREVADRLSQKGRLHFSCVTVKGAAASLLLAYILNRKMYVATSARDLKYANYDVGHLHEMNTLKDAIRLGLSEYDFLRGGEPYKFYWTSSFRRYILVTIAGNKFPSSLRLKLLYVFCRLSEIIRNRHNLREAVSILLMRMRDRRERKKMGLPVNLE